MMYIIEGRTSGEGDTNEGPGALTKSAGPETPDLARVFGAKLRQARHLAGLTQAQLAERLGITQVRVSNVERGTENPTLDVCAKFAAAVGVTIDDIVLSAGDMTLSEAVDTVALDSLITSLEGTSERLRNDINALREWRAKLADPEK